MKYFLKTVVILLLLSLFSCNILKENKSHKIEVDSASYEAWIIKGEERKGTAVKVKLTGNIQDIKILALVFQKEQIKPAVKINGDTMLVYADFEKGMKTVFPRPTITDKEDMIIYTYKGHIHKLQLKNIERKPTQYYTNR